MKKQDPLALAVFSAALALLAGLVLYVVLARPESSSGPRFSFLAPLRAELGDMIQAVRRDLPGARAPEAPFRTAPPAGRSWRYAIAMKPETWRDATLTYRTRPDPQGLAVDAVFERADAAPARFGLGIFAPNHPTHANTRFPGFFFYASYLPEDVKKGQMLSWSWAWQPAAPGRIKRFDARVQEWEQVKVPAGMYRALRLEADLLYIENGKVRARARETIWYAPEVGQVVKVVRDGRTPDEGLEWISAELVEFR